MTTECTIPGMSPKCKLWTLNDNDVSVDLSIVTNVSLWYSIVGEVMGAMCRPGVYGNYVFSAQLSHEPKLLLKIKY